MMRILAKAVLRLKGEEGITLLETVVSLAILSTVSLSFLNGIAVSSQDIYIADERATAESLARTQMEWAKSVVYSYNATSYSTVPIPDYGDYLNYSANVTAVALNDPDDGIQRITVIISRKDRDIFLLESYKVDR